MSKKLFPDGLKPVNDMIKSYGLIPGIWFEMENVAPLSAIYNETDHLLSRQGIPLSVGGHRFLDMRDEWCVDYLDEKVIKLLKDSGYGYLKVDYNENIGVGCDGAESLGEGLRQYVLGSQNYFRRIHEKLPELVIENCASGGHRLEPSTMELCSQASFSDAHECKSIPIIAANVQRMIKPSQSQIWAVLRKEDDIHDIYLPDWADYATSGIYMDEQTSGYTVKYNVLDHGWGIGMNRVGENDYREKTIYIDAKWNPIKSSIIKNAGINDNFDTYARLYY